jgi:hypothetical protein
LIATGSLHSPLVVLVLAVGCRDHEPARSPPETSGVTAPPAASAGSAGSAARAGSATRGTPRVVALEVSEATATITGTRNAFDALLVRATLHARRDFDPAEGTLRVAAHCALPTRWEVIAHDANLVAMRQGEDRAVELVVSGSHLDAIPPACEVVLALVAGPRDRPIELAKLHWDGKTLLPGPLPSLARARDGGPSIKIEMRSLARELDGVAPIGTVVTGPYFLGARYTMTAARDFTPGQVRILANCTMPDGTHRTDEMATPAQLSHDALAAPVDKDLPLFMGSHIEVMPTTCDLQFELHHSLGHDPFPELLGRFSVAPTVPPR